MATNATITSTYSGSAAKGYISAALLAAPTLGNGNITIKQNIKYKQVVKKLASTGLLANATCDFTSAGSVTLTERIIEPKSLQVNLVLCKADYRSDWEAEQMGFSANDQMPPTFTDYLIANIIDSVAGSLETSIWEGVDAAGSFSGFTTLFEADSNIVDVSGTNITSSNVQAELAKVVEEVSDLNIYSHGTRPVIYAATNIITSYLISLGGYGASGLGSNGYKGEGPTGVQNAPLSFGGLKIVETPGLDNSKMVAAMPDNLWFGTGMLNDENEVSVLDMHDRDLSQNVRFSMRFTGSVQYGIGSEIVYYWIY